MFPLLLRVGAVLLGGVLRLGQWLDVFDEHPKQLVWCEAAVVEERSDAVKVHFKVSMSGFTWYYTGSVLLNCLSLVLHFLRHFHAY